MRFYNVLAFLSTFVAVSLLPQSASACEGPCITNITNEYIEKYATPMKTLMDHTNLQLASRFNLLSSTNCASHLKDAYAKVAYASLENAIFPSYFHGKCQQRTANGTLVNPPGCPNPDCPVVCGTPGSMVHFFPVLRNITVKAHEDIFTLLIKQDSESFQDVKTCVLDAMPTKKCPKESAHDKRSISRLFAAHISRSSGRHTYSGILPRENCYDDAIFEKDLYDVLQLGMVQMWSDVCDARKDFANCSWEKAMKAFILQFP
ncbi:hypothetical protein GGU10DRAFT_108249 [Lentinula aff. detonsa]|uniref:Uncharacterized protein n=1 Tax=Lentinula aff. detonsa TaxID=2804958 RepID=A0AA38L631_9AGAR|nr:hypothetical protein GGU10DRAFT_108249 [Lentinula aff. detonsa]